MTHNTRTERALIAAYEAWTAENLDRTLEAISSALAEPILNGPGDNGSVRLTGQDAIDAANDHARDLRKHDR